MDLTLISNAEAASASEFFLSCISGERDASKLDLRIVKNSSIIKLANMPRFKVHRPRAQEARATSFAGLDNVGIFNCQAFQGSVILMTVTLINNGRGKQFVRSQTAFSITPASNH